MNSGVNSVVAPVFLNAIAPRHLKGNFGTAFQVSLCLGLIFSEVLGLVWVFGTNELWPYCFLMGCLPAGLQIVLGLYRRFDPTKMKFAQDENKKKKLAGFIFQLYHQTCFFVYSLTKARYIWPEPMTTQNQSSSSAT